MSKTIRQKDGDIYLNSAGRAEAIEGADKSAQDQAEVLMTPLDKARDYGSELADLNIPEPVSTFAGKSIISKKVDEAIQRLKRMQERDAYATPDETIDRINKLVVETIGTGEFIFWVNTFLQDQSVSGESVLAVSLRHQSSARFEQTIEELIREGLSGER